MSHINELAGGTPCKLLMKYKYSVYIFIKLEIPSGTSVFVDAEQDENTRQVFKFIQQLLRGHNILNYGYKPCILYIEKDFVI